MSIEKYLKEKSGEIESQLLKDINATVEAAIKRYENIVEQLKEATRIVLPVNVLDILTSGGLIVSQIFKNEIDTASVNVHIAGVSVFKWDYQTAPYLRRGKFRVTLMVEPLKEGESQS
jgi:uncharacterized protein involved in outer membrane biogenesis